MEEKFVKTTEKVRKIISELDELKVEVKEAEKMYEEGMTLLDKTMKGFMVDKFNIEEVSLKTGKVIAKK
ncbi:hypothetical protein HOG47_06675 [archaeon]|jgi:hypothetical protein|nr:hypothetical protein [archaeon]